MAGRDNVNNSRCEADVKLEQAMGNISLESPSSKQGPEYARAKTGHFLTDYTVTSSGTNSRVSVLHWSQGCS